MTHRILEISRPIRLSGDPTRQDKAASDYVLLPPTIPGALTDPISVGLTARPHDESMLGQSQSGSKG